MKLEDIIKNYREEEKLTMQEFADRAGLSKGYMSMLEKGQHPQSSRKLVPSLETYKKISTAMGITIDNLLAAIDSDALVQLGAPKDNASLPDNILPMPKMRKIPLLGDIACGEPILAAENLDGEVDIPEDIRADFALRCKGDSMINARIFDGDIVYIRQQPTVDNGEIAAVLIDDEATLKRVRLFDDHIVLEPENPLYRPFVYWGEEMNTVRILGKAVAFLSTVR